MVVVMEPHQTEQLAALWTAAQATISAFIRTLIPDLHQADEVTQRVAVALVRKFDRYDTTRPFVAWAIGVAKYEVLYFRRQRATDKHVFNDELVDQIASRYELLATEVDPIRDALEYCVDELKGRSKRVIELRYRDGMKSDNIASEMGFSAGAVRMLLCRVRDTLRRCIERRIAGLDRTPITE
jgi:RNA polymerase sigma-70 factor (ECF subfamily)